MPRIIEVSTDTSATLEETIEALAGIDFDPTCDERTQQAAKCLRALTNNRTFLGDMLLDQIKHRHREVGQESGYGPQSIVLSSLTGNALLRANIWPAEDDLCFKASGAKSFVYGIPHDHNFSFLTSGYLGPGYRSDYYEYDYADHAGYPGERAKLTFVERSALSEKKLMLYRAHHDIHSQLPPESLSVSLNVMHVDPAQHWYDQYGFDLEEERIERVLSPNSTEAFLRIAVATGSDKAQDYAEWVGRHHPSERLRQASFEARCVRLTQQHDRDALWREAEGAGSRMLTAIARGKREELAARAR